MTVIKNLSLRVLCAPLSLLRAVGLLGSAIIRHLLQPPGGESAQVAGRAESLLDALVPSIRKAAGLVQEITSASEEQRSGVTQSNNSMRQLSQSTQQNASASEERAATAEEMSRRTRYSQRLMGLFSTAGGGRATQDVVHSITPVRPVWVTNQRGASRLPLALHRTVKSASRSDRA